VDSREIWEPDRRTVLKAGAAVAAAITVSERTEASAATQETEPAPAAASAMDINLHVNGVAHRLTVEPRVTLLDALRERLALTGTKKGCDRGECGACTVLVDGRRIKSCMTLAVMQRNASITTIEGLGQDDELHPLQAAFIRHDAFQCGACTPGQIMSGVACIKEGHARSADEIREWMSGNLCRCSCYASIVDAVQDAAREMGR